MIGHKNCLQADYLLGPGPRFIKKNLPGRSLTKFEKHMSIGHGPGHARKPLMINTVNVVR
jgi:hypothetical protein